MFVCFLIFLPHCAFFLSFGLFINIFYFFCLFFPYFFVEGVWDIFLDVILFLMVLFFLVSRFLFL